MKDDAAARARGILCGMSAAEKKLDEEAPLSSMVRDAALVVSSCADDEQFSETISDVSFLSPLAAIPIGLRFWNQLPNIIDWARTDGFMPDTSGKCAAVATGMLVSNSMFLTPSGVWASEIANVISGIDDHFVGLLNLAVSLAGEARDPGPSIALLRGSGGFCCGTVAAAIYCCVLGRDRPSILAAAAEGGDLSAPTTALAGALSGTPSPPGGEWDEVVEALLPPP
jgi:hypothetical protein